MFNRIDSLNILNIIKTKNFSALYNAIIEESESITISKVKENDFVSAKQYADIPNNIKFLLNRIESKCNEILKNTGE